MGVDIQTYRAKIGTFKHAYGLDVVTMVFVVNFTRGLKTIGSVLFIGILLVMAGIETNPGPIETENIQPAKIRVSRLPENASAEFLTMFFENEKRQGGGKVKCVTMDDDNCSAVIEFEEPSAIEIVMKKRPILINEKEVEIETLFTSSPSKESPSPTKMRVSGLPDDASADYLSMFFENEKRQGGGMVKCVTMDDDKRSAVVEFEEPSAIETVMKKRPIIMFGKEVDIEPLASNQTDESFPQTKMRVSGLPENASADFLTLFFENEKRQGGGLVRCVTMDDDNFSAVVEFEEPSAIEIVMKKRPIFIFDKEVEIETLESFPSEDIMPLTKIKVSGLPENVSADYLTLFFENEKRQGGGLVKCVTMHDGNCFAIVEFEEPAAIEIIMKKRPIVIFDKEVEVEALESFPSKDIIQPTKIKVSGLPENVSDHYLTLFFENEKRQGGGLVKCVTMNDTKRSAVVEFEEPSAVSKVLSKKPILICEQEVTVEIDEEGRKTGSFNRKSSVHAQRKGGEELATKLSKCHTESSLTHLTVSQVTEESVTGKLIPKYTEQTQERRRQNTAKYCSKSDTESSSTHSVVSQVTSYGDDIISRAREGASGKIFNIVGWIRRHKESFTRSQPIKMLQTFLEGNKDEGRRFAADIKERQSKITVCGESNVGGKQVLSEPASPVSPNAKENTSSENSHQPAFESEGEMFWNVLQKLNLTGFYPGKISKRDVFTVDLMESYIHEKQCTSLHDIPWLILKRLMCTHSESRDITVCVEGSADNSEDIDNPMSFISEISEESQGISPLDVFTVVFQCCDPFMKQFVCQKLYLCKIAVPFLYTQWDNKEYCKPVLSVWPLRSLAIENKCSDTKSESKISEVDVLEMPTKVLAFAKFGRPRYSKSKLINSLLTNQGCKTFFNIDCPSGMTPRYLSNGQIEMFWSSTIGDKRDRFQEAMTFLNMRGDMNEHFEEDMLSFIANFVDAAVIVIDIETVLNQSDALRNVLLIFSSVILIIANPLKHDIVKGIQSFKNDVLASNPEFNLRVLSTHKGVIEQNVVDMCSSMLKHITSHLKANETKHYEQRLDLAKLGRVATDENDNHCQKGKIEAVSLIDQMGKEGRASAWKQILTPVQSTFSKNLGKLKKQRERERDFTEGNKIDEKIKDIREKQTQSITQSVKLFIDILMRYNKSLFTIDYFLFWLHFLIEREKRQIIPQLMYESRCAWETLKMLKNKKNHTDLDLKNQEEVIINLERKIDEASFSGEHFFREIGHIYDATLELKLCPETFGLPKVNHIAILIGRLVAEGHQFEIIDGESFYTPYKWIKAVMQETDKYINPSQVMTLSVLGLQSSGKSTLLNTMFGSQFFTRTGRCTRGIHVQLFPVTNASSGKQSSPFNYVLVTDTEGLRSPELSHVQHEHDNELATVITGIGDITMLNIMGENTSEIRDILQVIVHAFLRLKMTNRKLDIRKSCAFIHQNVTDTSASDNMISGLSKLMQALDEMTKEAARSEGISEITTFNQVIEFDINSQVWYLKNLWQGNPPMAKVNSEYSERAVDIKCQILKKASDMKDKSYKSLSDIAEQTNSLWKGVLNEDFVFSFRNSLEIRAYMEMERVVHERLWHLESLVRDELTKITQSSFANCNHESNLRLVAKKLTDELNNVLLDEKVKTEEVIKTYFEKNKYKDITIQWKKGQQSRIDSLCFQLTQIIVEQVEKSQGKRSVEILTVASHEKHEAELQKRSIEVANEYKGQHLTQEQINKLFDDIWQSFVTKISTTVSISEQKGKNMRNVFETCLKNIFENHYAVIKGALKQSKYLTPLPNLQKLGGSFVHTGVNEYDISLTWFQKGLEMFSITDVLNHITLRVNQIFEALDEKIVQLCQINEEITEMSVNKLMHELDASIHAISTGKNKYDFKTPFYAKIYVHVSRYAHHLFEKHNENYFKTHGTSARLEKYKQQQKISFEAHLSSRRSEDIVAKLFCNVIECFAEEVTLESLPNRITNELHSHLPSVKNIVLIDICSDLLEQNVFHNFIRFLQAPKEYAGLWITDKANFYLFAKESKAYARTAGSLLNQFFTTVEQCVTDLKQKYIGKPTPSIETWINDFHMSLDKSNYSIPPERFRNMKMEIKHIKNVEYLTKEMLNNLLESKERIVDKFSKYGSGSVTWENSNPIVRITKKIWGCTIECAFCGEPCAKSDDNHDSVHYCIQHRPSCCKGVRDTESKKAFLESCEFDIQSDKTHKCNVFDYLCNEGTREDCSKGIHNYRDYKQFLPQWDIAPTSNMHDSSKFWMWFVATYKKELQDHYQYLLDHIPPSWDEITREEANESLFKTYSA